MYTTSIKIKIRLMKKTEGKTRDWYSDKYSIAIVQRNLVLLFAVVTSIGILFSLILVKFIYENRSIEPYLLEIDKKSGIATIVDSKTVAEYTASQVVKESYIIKYIMAREGYKQVKEDEDRNIVRLFSNKYIYDIYGADETNVSVRYDLKGNNNRSTINIIPQIRSFSLVYPKVAEVKFARNIYIEGKLFRKRFFKVNISFDFFDLQLSLSERYINPFGFQVTSYSITEEFLTDADQKDDDKSTPQTQATN
jgi:type IV secretion system protein VirB8